MAHAFLTGVHAAVAVISFTATLAAVVGVIGFLVNAVERKKGVKM